MTIPGEVGHTAWAREIRVPTDLLTSLVSDGLINSIRKHGSVYYLNRASAPTAAAVIQLARTEYEARLNQVLEATSRFETECEAIRFDVAEMLEHGVEPVGRFGNDVAEAMEFRGGKSALDQARSDLMWAAVRAHALHGALFEYDQAQRRSHFFRAAQAHSTSAASPPKHGKTP
jgi:hypothetical protein